jgi:hypothetical protein
MHASCATPTARCARPLIGRSDRKSQPLARFGLLYEGRRVGSRKHNNQRPYASFPSAYHVVSEHHWPAVLYSSRLHSLPANGQSSGGRAAPSPIINPKKNRTAAQRTQWLSFVYAELPSLILHQKCSRVGRGSCGAIQLNNGTIVP